MYTIPEIKAAVVPIFAEVFGREVADSVSVSFDADHDGDPSIYLRANVPEAAIFTWTEKFTDLREKIHGKLNSMQELRFPFFRFDFGDAANTIDDSPQPIKLRRRG